MVALRKVTVAALLAASLAVLALAVYLFWDYRQGQYLLDRSYTSSAAIDERSRALEYRVETLTRRVGDMELLVVILLGTSGLYAIVFVLSSFFSAVTFARQADRSIASIRDQLGAAMGDLRELQEEARDLLHQGLEAPSATPEKLRQEVREILREEAPRSHSAPGSTQAQVDTMTAAIAGWSGVSLDSQSKLALLHYESAAAGLELTGGPQLGPSLAVLYRRFAEIYTGIDKARQLFYLNRALVLLPPDSQPASEIHYELACWFADSGDFAHSIGELALAFQHQSKALDDRLAKDIDEGGRLYQLACTPPFDKALNDLLLNMSIGIA